MFETTLDGSISATDTTVTVNAIPDSVGANDVWIVIDPYTSECEVRKVTAVSSLDLTVAAIDYAHSSGDCVLFAYSPMANVKWFGAKGDNSTDDTTALNRALLDKHTYIPEGTYKVSSKITIPDGAVVVCEDPKLESSIEGVVVEIGTRAHVRGKLQIDCNSEPGSIALQFGPLDIYHCVVEYVKIWNAAIGIMMESNGTSGAYHNQINYARIESCTTGIKFKTTSGVLPKANANWFGYASIQYCDEGVVVDMSEGQAFGYLEVQECDSEASGYAIDLIKCKSFFVNAGWLEKNGAEPSSRNIRIANSPDVSDVLINAQIDNFPTSISYTYSPNRAIRIIGGSNHVLSMYGQSNSERFEVGTDGTAGDDDNVADRFRVSGSMYCYRMDSNDKYFQFYAPTAATGFRWMSGGSTIARLKSGGDLDIWGSLSVQATNARILSGSGTPESAVTAAVGSIFLRDDGGASTTLYVKESGTGSTGWVAK